jgi:hypothetical protein
MLFVSGGLVQDRSRDFRNELRLARAQHLMYTVRCIRIRRVAFLQLPGQRDLVGVLVGDRQVIDRAILLANIYGAPVCYVRHHQTRHAGKRLAVVERG